MYAILTKLEAIEHAVDKLANGGSEAVFRGRMHHGSDLYAKRDDIWRTGRPHKSRLISGLAAGAQSDFFFFPSPRAQRTCAVGLSHRTHNPGAYIEQRALE